MPSIKRGIFIGIDPGKSGGLAAIECLKHKSRIEVVPMPATERDIDDWFKGQAFVAGNFYVPMFAIIEKVHSMPKQGVKSMFTFGMNYGGLRMALIANGIPFRESTPQEWMKAMGMPKKDTKKSNSVWKNQLKAKAQQLYPALTLTLKTADAALIATYARRVFDG